VAGLEARDADPALLVESAEEREQLAGLLEQVSAHLSEENARFLQLRLVEGREVAEVAHLFGMTPKQVWERQHWLLGKLRARMRGCSSKPGEAER
jgi:DNA-directed RNA polymerase specialized sigma24 family protein